MPDQSLRVPTFCPLCSHLMKGKSTNSYYSHGVCINCFIQFIDGRVDRWNSGWRPSEQELQTHKDVISNSH